MFGVPTVPCGSREVHPYHGDGTTTCPGVYPWDLTLADLFGTGTAHEHATFDDLDQLARANGVVGGTHATDDPHRRGGHVVIDGALHVGPARRLAHSGQWVAPGQDLTTIDSERESDRQASIYYGRA